MGYAARLEAELKAARERIEELERIAVEYDRHVKGEHLASSWPCGCQIRTDEGLDSLGYCDYHNAQGQRDRAEAAEGRIEKLQEALDLIEAHSNGDGHCEERRGLCPGCLAHDAEAEVERLKGRIEELENKTYQYVTLTGDTDRISLKDAVQRMTAAEAEVERLKEESKRLRSLWVNASRQVEIKQGQLDNYNQWSWKWATDEVFLRNSLDALRTAADELEKALNIVMQLDASKTPPGSVILSVKNVARYALAHYHEVRGSD